MHKFQNTLDVVITHESTDIMSNFLQGEIISYHFAVHFNMHVPLKPRCERIIKFRKVKETDASRFATDLQKALVPLTFPNLAELSKLVDGYSQVVSSVLDQHAPLKTKRVESKHCQQWYCSDIGDVVRNWRNLERIWRGDIKNKDKWAAFNKQQKVTQVIIKKREKGYYHLLFLEKASNPKEVFRIRNALLARNNISPLPKCSSLTELANGLSNFFVDKMMSIRDNIINTHFNGIQPTAVEPVSALDFPEMDSFHHVSESSYKKRIRELSSKRCKLDPMPTMLLKSVVEVITPVIPCIINVSLLSGEFSKTLKDVLLQPLIKKMGLELFFKSFHLISHLSYILSW